MRFTIGLGDLNRARLVVALVALPRLAPWSSRDDSDTFGRRPEPGISNNERDRPTFRLVASHPTVGAHDKFIERPRP
jgi:hypothetical protein